MATVMHDRENARGETCGEPSPGGGGGGSGFGVSAPASRSKVRTAMSRFPCRGKDEGGDETRGEWEGG